MALRTEDFHAVTPDGRVQDRGAMENYTIGLLNGIDRWISLNFDSAASTACAINAGSSTVSPAEKRLR